MSGRVPIVVQLIVGFSAILLIILSITGYYSYRISAEVVLGKTAIYLNESVNQLSGKVDVNLQEYDKATQLISFSPTLQQYLLRANDGLPGTITKLELEQFMSQQIRYIAVDSVLHVTDLRGEYYTSNTIISMLHPTEARMKVAYDWYETVERSKGRMVWVASSAWRYGEFPAFIGARQVNDWERLEKLGSLFIVLPVDSLERLVGEINLGTSGKIVIVDGFGKIVYSSDAEEIGSPMDESLLAQLREHPRSMFEWEQDGENVYVSHAHSEYSGWRVAAFIGADEAVAELKGIQRSITVIGATGLLAAFLFTSIFAWTLARPIAVLAKRLTRLEKGFVRPFGRVTGNRETAMLYDSYNQMIGRLDQTVKDLSEKQISEKQAQIVALKAQFRPHFLYNSLNTIYWTLINEGQFKTAEMVLQLSDLLRYSIQPGSDLVALEEDVAQLRRFIAISRARYGDKLQTEIDIEPDIMKERVMKLLLQPLVENAITHGLEQVKGRPWIIRIRGTREGARLHFTVEDNGVGMPQETIDETLSQKPKPEVSELMHSGIGLSNLRHRISLTYGSDYGLQLGTGELGGLRVDIVVPALSERPNGANGANGAAGASNATGAVGADENVKSANDGTRKGAGEEGGMRHDSPGENKA
ncbi:sensor histidine kinase [Paenibacillus sp.]|uniref:sensor histidine kinase n=1 Tax=Paenibacillus sp. TaxID=58172 RepID=UPI002D64FBC1|nr:sensor histidine kinase [Paenibacillus sp.]HZG57165.1 sensor histidine kinase [Paenibacillus sp.]